MEHDWAYRSNSHYVYNLAKELVEYTPTEKIDKAFIFPISSGRGPDKPWSPSSYII